MTDVGIAYFAGLVTLPFLFGIVAALLWAIGPSNVIAAESKCGICSAAGYPKERFPTRQHRSRLAQALHDLRHTVRARQRRHRIAWQAYADAHPGWAERRGSLAQRRYGVPEQALR